LLIQLRGEVQETGGRYQKYFSIDKYPE